jgi:hypothetical protein
MSDRYAKCGRCPAYHLLNDERKETIARWEYKRQKNVDRIRQMKLILIGESMPSKRYFYDLETDYENTGMRFNLMREFGQIELSDGQFMESFRRKGIVLYDCALCPLHKLDSNVDKRRAATYCFLTQNLGFLKETKDIPIATIFPSNRGWLKTEIPYDIIGRVSGEFGFNDVSGLKDLYLEIKQEKR